ncbi:MAG: hypothetical protein K5905_26970 [Roseibium sp.]|uniref:hypothetical protein n=1 Tax=Roseibium sp. TaxID=1936156 RepID=UPI0026233251|nr:hypothetical protein [Roseibium sp.]MCV0429112.1 hypothetical protein [Roseibium sp.]
MKFFCFSGFWENDFTEGAIAGGVRFQVKTSFDVSPTSWNFLSFQTKKTARLPVKAVKQARAFSVTPTVPV